MIDTLIQSIVDKWDNPLPLYKNYAPEGAQYPFAVFNINPAGVERTFCSDILSFSVIFTIFTQSPSSASSQTFLNDVRSIYNRASMGSDVIYFKILSEILNKDDLTGYYTGSGTYIAAVGE